MVKSQLIFILFISAIFYQCQSDSIISVAPQISPYFESGAVNLVQLTSSPFQYNATITYNFPKILPPKILISYHSVDYDLNQIFTVNGSLLLNIQLYLSSSSATGFKAIAEVSTTTQLKSMKYGYFVFDKAFPYFDSFDFNFVIYPNRNCNFTFNHKPLSPIFTIFLWGLNLQVHPWTSISPELFHVSWESNSLDNTNTQFYLRSTMTNYNNLQTKVIFMAIYPTTIPENQYISETFIIHIPSNTTSAFQSNIFVQGKSHVIIGLNSFRLDGNQNSPASSFTFDIIHQTTGLFSLKSPSTFELAVHGFIIHFMGCPTASHPFRKYNTTTSIYECHQSCAIYQFQMFDIQNWTYTCETCSYPCATCSNQTICITCVSYMDLNSSFGCTLKNTYANVSGTIGLCSNSIPKCLTCLGDGSKCTSCISGYALSATSTACVPCTGIDSHCKTCTYQYCLSCNSEYVLQNPTSCIIPTSPLPSPPIICDTNCSKCDSSNQRYCLICKDSQYVLQNGICKTICGDGKIMGDEQCDDGNLQNFDGCSSQCKIEQSFQCTSTPYSFISSKYNTSVCKFTQPITFVIRRMIKDPYSNTFIIYIQTSIIYASVWSGVNLTQIIELEGDMIASSITQVQISFDKVFLSKVANVARLLQESTYDPKSFCYINVYLSYNSTIEGKDITININPRYSGLSMFQQLSAYQSSIKLVADNNALANFYGQTYNRTARALNIFSMILGVISFVMVLVGCVLGNMIITLQTSFFFQLSYFSLLDMGQLNPFWHALSGLKYSSGYNFPVTIQQPIYEQKNHKNFIGIGLFSQAADNVNISLILIVLTLLIGVIMKLLVKFVIKNQQLKQKLTVLSSNFIGSISFYLLHSFTFLFIVSIAINFMTFTSSSNNAINYLIISLCLLLIICFVGVFIKCSQTQTQFFSRIQQKISQLNKASYIISMLVLKVICGVVIVVLGEIVVGYVVVCVLYVGWVVLVIVKLKPYRQANNIRFVLSLALCFFIQLMFIYQRFSTYFTPQQQSIHLYLPLSIIILLFIILSLNLAFYLYSIKQIRCCQLDLQWQRVKDKKKSINTKTLSQNNNSNKRNIDSIQIDDSIISHNGITPKNDNIFTPNICQQHFLEHCSHNNSNGKKLSNKFYDTNNNQLSQPENGQSIHQQNPLQKMMLHNNEQQLNQLAINLQIGSNTNRQLIQQQIKRQLKSSEINSKSQQLKKIQKKQYEASLLLKNTDYIYSRLKHSYISSLQEHSLDTKTKQEQKYIYTKQQKYCVLQQYGKL